MDKLDQELDKMGLNKELLLQDDNGNSDKWENSFFSSLYFSVF